MADFVKNGMLYAGGMVFGPNEDYAIVFDVDGTLKIVSDPFRSSQSTVVTYSTAGAIIQSGAVTSSRQPAVNLAAASQTLTAAQSGQTFVGVVDAVFTLPAAATVGAGVHYYIVTGVASGGTGLVVTANGADDIFAAGVDTAAGGSITNSGATDAIGDNVHLVSDGVSRWVGVSARGTWA